LSGRQLLLQGFPAILINASTITCPLPRLPRDSLGEYQPQVSGNNQQWISAVPPLPDSPLPAVRLRVYGVPAVTSIFPSTGPASGVLPISVYGQAFELLPRLKCIYNGTISARAAVINSTLIVCEAVGAGVFAAGAQHSVQITPDGDFFSDASFAFAYYSAQQCVPASGPVTGSTVMRIHGVHITGPSPQGILCKLQYAAGDEVVVSGRLVDALEMEDGIGSDSREGGLGVAARRVSAIECTTPNMLALNWLAPSASSARVTVAISLHGSLGLTPATDQLSFTLYRDPQVFSGIRHIFPN
jgi:hypothetical protein